MTTATTMTMRTQPSFCRPALPVGQAEQPCHHGAARHGAGWRPGALALTACGGGSPSLPLHRKLTPTPMLIRALQAAAPPANHSLPPTSKPFPLPRSQPFPLAHRWCRTNTSTTTSPARAKYPSPRPARGSRPGPPAISGNSTARKIQAPGTISIRSSAPWLTTPPLHATASGDNTATRQCYLARSRDRLPMMSGPGADLSKPPMRHWQAHRRQPHRHGQRQLARLPKQPAPTTSNASTAPPGCTSTTCRSHGSRQSSDGAISPSPTAFSQGSAGDHHIHGRFHGQDHSEGWGIFHTNAYVGAFCAKRQLQQWPEPSQFRRCCKRSA